MAQPWMLFQAYHPQNDHAVIDLFYFWNGTWPVVVKDGEGLPISETGWTGREALDLTDEEIKFLNELAKSKRKHVFHRKKDNRKYLIVARGTFPEML